MEPSRPRHRLGHALADSVRQGPALSAARPGSARAPAGVSAVSLRLLITGSTGQIGWQLQRTLAPLGEVIACTRTQLDLADPEAAAKFVRELAPDVVVNAAAYTAVDKAESEPERAHTINAAAPGRIAEELARTGGLLVHYS